MQHRLLCVQLHSLGITLVNLNIREGCSKEVLCYITGEDRNGGTEKD